MRTFLYIFYLLAFSYTLVTAMFVAVHYANGVDFPVWPISLWPLALLGIALGL